MIKKMTLVLFSGLMLLNVSGCLALLAGGAAAGGTAVWLSNKMTQQINAPYDRVFEAAKKALAALDYEVTKVSRSDTAAQINGKVTDGKEIWIDINKTTDTSTKVSVRVGAVHPDKEAAEGILKKIQELV